MKRILIAILAFTITTPGSAQDKIEPSFEDVLSLKGVGSPQISPDGNHVLFTINSTDWEENRYDTEIWLSKSSGEPFQLTNNPQGSSSSPRWSPDGNWISFISKRGEKNQIFLMRFAGGEAFQFTNSSQGVGSYEWSPDGRQIAFTQAQDKSKPEKKRKKKFGGFAVEDNEYSMTELWLVDFKPEMLGDYPLPEALEDSVYKANFTGKPIIQSDEYTIRGFSWSPDGKYIAFNKQPDPLINSFFEADIAIYDVEKDEHTVLVNNPSSDGFTDWSPDSKSILYYSSVDNKTTNYYENDRVFRIDINGKKQKELALDFDEDLSGLTWTTAGIFGTAWQRTDRKLLRIDPEKGTTQTFDLTPNRIYSFTFDKAAKKIAFTGNTDNTMTEVYTADLGFSSIRKITNSNDQIKNWRIAQSEVITWKSKDGTEIEGVLHKPDDYDPNKKYPLLVAIHGGPTGISTPTPVPAYVYPQVQWLNKGALVLRPNYRGSAGYGAKFRALNVKNLGVGDAWDVESGVKYLIDQGMVDANKVGSMGWSQGGYISAFLTTNSTMFKAISVGAGISNWMTYYVNTDIHPFTRQYLLATPWSDKTVYEKTSPMTNINNAKTPTLIQHGEFDKRVPPANAFELYQGLQDVGVETKLIIYKGFGHGITKPKERLAAT